ncbi:MAG: transcriptional regulator [Candidatus Eremiobacteraeota bacterium]|nr:transcriptional regulator [Candidatus Eremiobacteraeota bacterium]
MYVPAHFRIDDRAALRAFMRAHAFATLVTVADGAPFATHLPLLVDGAGDELVLRGHVARANPQWRTLEEQDALAVFTGPHAYVSPSWYTVAQSVPTWNYTAVHASGRGRLLTERGAVMDVLCRLTDTEEARFAQPWSVDRLSEDYLDGMRRAIVAFEIPVARLDGKYKLSQNRSAADRTNVSDALGASADPSAREVAELMRAQSLAGREYRPWR